jgi:AcrR family transcriptional regulator
LPRTQPISRREQNKRRTRDAILKAAAVRFARVGIGNATMDEIADAAEISRATLFNYFSNKAELVATLADRMDDDLVGLIEHHRDRAASTADRIVGVFTQSGRNIELRGDIVRPLVGISWQSWGEDAGVARMARLTDAFVGLLGGNRPADDVRADIDLRLLAEILVSTYVGLIHNWRIADTYPLETRLGAAARLLGEMIARR